MTALNIDDILLEIEQQRAVLLLGQNFLPQTHEALHRHLTLKLGDKLRHFYSRDGLFLFADNDSKITAQIQAAEFSSFLVETKILTIFWI